MAQVTPIAVTGFNNDAVAEGPPSSLATTTLQVDGGFSNRVMYTSAFSAFAGIGGGGLPDNGTIVNGGDTYQLANYTGNNALYIYRNETRGLTLVTPASYSRVRILGFTTEGASALNVRFSFTDGSFTDYFTNYSLPDWFNGAANVVLQGFGRCSRVAAAPWGADAFPSNPRMYYIEVSLNCADKNKSLQSVFFSNFSTFPNNAPFPNAVILGLSGTTDPPPTITPVITPCDCNGPNGSVTLTATGTTGPYTYSWNTSPAQTGPTATGLAPGNHLCNITDANGCVIPYTATVPLNNNGAIAVNATPLTVCPGDPVSLSINVVNGIYGIFGLRPVTTPASPYTLGQTQTVNPLVTTTYQASAQRNAGGGWWTPCDVSAFVTVTVYAVPADPIVPNLSVCPGANAILQVQSPVAGYTYNWYTTATGGTPIATGISYTVLNVTAAATYYVEAINTTSCSSAARTPVTISLNAIPAAPLANDVSVCAGDDAMLQVQSPQAGYTYNWYNAAAAGSPIGTGVSFTVNNVTANTIVYVEAVNTTSCTSTTRTAVNISLLVPLSQPVVTITNTTFTSLTFSWNAVPGATAYEVTTNGGATYQAPSTGSLGTSHTISGLTGNTTVILQVRALKNLPCETSLLSAPVSGTTLSSKEIFVPNVFTPNGDGRNDVLLVYGNHIGSIQFRIFNQWGQLVFASDNISIGWNGIYNGRQQPIGVYAYTLKVVLQDGTIINKKGSINLIR